jgi:zinc and cadmium transporter
VTYSLASSMDVTWLIPFAAGNFLYIGASDLVPEVSRHAKPAAGLLHLAAFLVGICLLLATRGLA